MTGITAAVPYAFSALAQMKWRIADRKAMETPRFVRDMIVAVLAVLFPAFFVYYSRNTGHSFWVYWAPFLLTAAAFLLGIPVYRTQRRRATFRRSGSNGAPLPRRARRPALRARPCPSAARTTGRRRPRPFRPPAGAPAPDRARR